MTVTEREPSKSTGEVEEYWLVDTEEQSIDIYRLQERPTEPLFVFYSGEAFESKIFPSLRFEVDRIFRE